MILPNQNLSIMDVRNCLGVPSTDLGTLCSSSNAINMWAKYKPVRYNFTYNRPTNWYTSSNYNCGINYSTYTNIGQLATAMDSGNAAYTYEVPRGGEAEPFRLGDFASYDSNAKPPIHAAPMQETYYKTQNTIAVSAFRSVNYDTWLSVNDVFGGMLSNEIYFGAAIKLKSSSGTPMYMTEATPLTNDGGGGILNYPTTYLSTGTNVCYMFLTDTPKTDPMSPAFVATFIPLSNGRSEFNLISTGIRISLTPIRNSNGIISGNVTVYNTYGYAVNMTNVWLEFRYASSTPTSQFRIGEGREGLNSFTVPADGSYTVPFSVSGLLDDFYEEGGGYVNFIANNGTYTATSMIMYEMQP